MTLAPGLLAHTGDLLPVDPVPMVGLALAGAAYGEAVMARRRRGRLPITRRHVAAFAAGLGTVAVALSPPLERMAAERFAAHMLQHLLLILVAAPLVAAGRPVRVIRGAHPPARRRRTGRRLGSRLRPLRVLAGHPVVVWMAASAGLWLWHSPALYGLALRHEAVHAAEHLTFFAAFAWFWTKVINAGRPRTHTARRLSARPAALALTFATALASGALGAVLTFAGAPLYPEQAARAAAAGVSPLEDQQLAGALMWMPPGLVYLATMAVLLVRWFADLDAHTAETIPVPLQDPVR